MIMENNHSSDIYDMKYAIWRIYIALGKQLLTNKKCHKHVTNAPKGIGLAQDTFEER